MDDRQPVVRGWVSCPGFVLINMALIKVELDSLGPGRFSRWRIGVNSLVEQVATDTISIVYGADFLQLTVTVITGRHIDF